MWINRKIIDNHQQKFTNSCVPSAVEMILKLEGIMNPNSYFLQEAYGNNPRCGDDFDKKIFTNGNLKIKFYKILLPSLKNIFDCIDSELNDNRCVLIPLKTSPDGANCWTCHVHVVYDFSADGEYKTLTKLPGQDTIDVTDTRTRFTKNYNEMITRLPEHRLGIDFLTYERL
jgi:hypothetical protein